MGGGAWSASTYNATTATSRAAGTNFGYSSATAAAPRDQQKAHENVDPKRLCGPTSPFAGKNIRESRDSTEHPNSVPVAVVFDTTGSMGHVPMVVQEKLPGLLGLLLRKGYLADPHIMIGAYGDAYCDAVPLQISPFESDNRIDENVDSLYLEGGGGGNGGETMSLAWYFLAHHTDTDAWNKRGKKGYAFFIADEVALPVLAKHVEKFVLPDDGEGGHIGEVASDLSVAGLARALQEKWDAYILVIPNYTSQLQGSLAFYRELFGERVIVLDDPAAMAETVGTTIGLMEGAVDLDDAAADLQAIGTDAATITTVTKALATVGASSSGGALVKSETPSDLDDSADANVRL